MSEIDVCALDDIENDKARGFTVQHNNESVDIVIVRQADTCFSYRNSCPHTGVNLEWQPDEFLSNDGNYLQCAMHGAMFRVEDGKCVAGPCNGESLQAIESISRNGRIVVMLAD